MLLGKSRMVTALQQAAKRSPADETLLAAQRGAKTTLRFAGGAIHQNFHEEDVTVWVKVAAEGRTGVATTSSLSDRALARAIASALQIARLPSKQTAPAFSTHPPREEPAAIKTHFPMDHHQNLAEKIQMIRQLSQQTHRAGMELAGSFAAGEEEFCVAGSGGLVQYQPFSTTGLRLIPTQGKASGFAAGAVRDPKTLNPHALLRQALDHCRHNRNSKTIRLGQYSVLLEPEAVAELVEWLSYIAFGAKQLHERTSCFAGRMGEQLTHPTLSIWDDGTDARGLAVPFDFEGIPKGRVPLVEDGRACGVVFDSQYAKLYRRHSTGHAPAFDEAAEGPLATHLFVAPGKMPHHQMLQCMDRGLWITRFHYVNGLLDTQQALMTGLTRDGTFLVNKGKVVGAVKNLRFTQSMLQAFSKIQALSKEVRLVADPISGSPSVVTPAVLLKGFTFTGQTK